MLRKEDEKGLCSTAPTSAVCSSSAPAAGPRGPSAARRAAKQFDAEAIDLAVRAHVRHVHTGYDVLLGRGSDREFARAAVRHDIERVLGDWRRP